MVTVETSDGVEMDRAELTFFELEGEARGSALVVHQSAQRQGPGAGVRDKRQESDIRNKGQRQGIKDKGQGRGSETRTRTRSGPGKRCGRKKDSIHPSIYQATVSLPAQRGDFLCDGFEQVNEV